jgi:hypothetical protein
MSDSCEVTQSRKAANESRAEGNHEDCPRKRRNGTEKDRTMSLVRRGERSKLRTSWKRMEPGAGLPLTLNVGPCAAQRRMSLLGRILPA